jgi:putative flippase GtrA
MFDLKSYILLLLSSKLIKFLFVGGTATLLQFGFLTLFVEKIRILPVVASAGAYLLSAVYNYILNYRLTFKSKKRHAETLPKFLMVVGIGVLINTVVFAAAWEILGLYLIAQTIAVFVTLVVNFLLHKYWIYQE